MVWNIDPITRGLKLLIRFAFPHGVLHFVWNIDPITRGLKHVSYPAGRAGCDLLRFVWNIDPITRGLKLKSQL